jgi:predicted HAD superfamily Cof-like phosphohydrolase
VRPLPTATIDEAHRTLRERLLLEEVDELHAAMAAGDLTGIAHELADVLYVLYGTALTYGIDLDEVVAAVHNSNMSRLGADGRPLVRADGKVLKGPNYRAPDIERALGRQYAPSFED